MKGKAGLNSFVLTPRQWIDATNAIGVVSKAGRYDGTYAHKDIAFDAGFISIDENYHLMVSKKIRSLEWDKAKMLMDYENKKITLPNRFIPDQEFLAFHRKEVFIN